MKKTSFQTRFYSFILLCLLFSLTLFANTSLACSCAVKQDWKNAAEEASVIFIGHVEKISEDPIKTKFNKVKFSISKTIKGLDHLDTEDINSKKILVLNTAKESASCGFKFKQNGEYLVYANGSPASLKVSSCSRTAFFEVSKEEATNIDEHLNYEIEYEEVVVTTTTSTTKPKIRRPSGPSQIGF